MSCLPHKWLSTKRVYIFYKTKRAFYLKDYWCRWVLCNNLLCIDPEEFIPPYYPAPIIYHTNSITVPVISNTNPRLHSHYLLPQFFHKLRDCRVWQMGREPAIGLAVYTLDTTSCLSQYIICYTTTGSISRVYNKAYLFIYLYP